MARRASYGNALLMDGVDTRDPQGGSAWTFFNQNLIEEIQIGGLGAPAEYGGFTGAIINTVTKSGSNAFSGLFSMRYTERLAGVEQRIAGSARREPRSGTVGRHARSSRTTPCRWAARSRRTRRSSSRSIQRYSAHDRSDRPGRQLAATSARAST